MSAMDHQRDLTCPLCEEAMDLTDQQFKPCECGYQICVWCWHHMVEAEKNEVLCPACHSPYDKEKIKRMTINDDRLAEISSRGKKKKSQKAKSSTSDVRYDPNEDRVIQRTLVYVIGIPDYLANEEMLRKREFFGQYGKVIRILFKPPSKSSQPQYTKTCAIYVTFSVEEEAVRCIQVVDGFVLNGSPLKACYGTTRYCHAWLKNKTCQNANCSYLHYTALPGDICTKEETIVVCASKMQPYSRITSNLGQRRGSFLPLPIDNYCSGIDETLVSPITPSNCDCDEDQRGGADEKFETPSRADSCNALAAASPRESSISSAGGQGPVNTLSISSVTSAAIMDVQTVDHDQDRNQSEVQTQAIDVHNNCASSEEYCASDYPVHNMGPTQGGSFGNNMWTENAIHKPFSLWSNDDIIQSIMTDLDCSDLDGHKKLTPCTRFEAEGASVCVNNKELKNTRTREAVALIGQKVHQLSGFTDDGKRTSFTGERERLYTDYSGISEQDELSTQKLVEDMVQNIDALSDFCVDRRRYPFSDKKFVDSSEYGFKSAISLDHGLVDHQMVPRGSVEYLRGTDKGDCLNIHNSLLPQSNSESSYFSRRLDIPKHTTGHSFPGYADLQELNRDYRLLNIGETVLTDESVSVPMNLQVHNSNCGYSSSDAQYQSHHLLRLPQSASSVAMPVICTPPSDPPGFPTRLASDIGRSSATPFSSGATQFKLYENQSLTNFCQGISGSNSYFITDPINAIKMASSGLTYSDYCSSDVTNFGGSDPNVQYPYQYLTSSGNPTGNSLLSTDQSNSFFLNQDSSNRFCLNQDQSNYYVSQNLQNGMKKFHHGSCDESEHLAHSLNREFWAAQD